MPTTICLAEVTEVRKMRYCLLVVPLCLVDADIHRAFAMPLFLLPFFFLQSQSFNFNQSGPMATSAGPLDAIVIPGGGSQRDESCTSLPLSVRRRLDLGLQRWYEHIAAFPSAPQPYLIVLSAGTVHRPNFINSAGWPISEATSGAQYLVEMSAQGKQPVPPEKILRENVSLDTIGNAFFTRVMHTDVLRLRRLHVITSAFHFPRTKAIFEFVFAIPAPSNPKYTMTYEEASDDGVYADAELLGRVTRERQSLISFRATLEKRFGLSLSGDVPASVVGVPSLSEVPAVDIDSWSISPATEACAARGDDSVSLAAVHRWLFSDHTAYATRTTGMVRTDTVDAATLATY